MPPAERDLPPAEWLLPNPVAARRDAGTAALVEAYRINLESLAGCLGDKALLRDWRAGEGDD